MPWEKIEAEGWHPVSSIQKQVEKHRGSIKNQADKAGRQKKKRGSRVGKWSD